eukprot:31764-Chlamydomonas_euryale.AAC.3
MGRLQAMRAMQILRRWIPVSGHARAEASDDVLPRLARAGPSGEPRVHKRPFLSLTTAAVLA